MKQSDQSIMKLNICKKTTVDMYSKLSDQNENEKKINILNYFSSMLSPWIVTDLRTCNFYLIKKPERSENKIRKGFLIWICFLSKIRLLRRKEHDLRFEI